MKDIELGIEFYCGLGGLLTSRDLEKGEFIDLLLGSKNVIVKTCKIKFRDGSRIELMEFQQPKRLVVSGNRERVFAQGLHHLAFTVADIEVAKSFIRQLGGEGIGETLISTSTHSVHAARAKHIYMFDPFGNLIHLAEDLVV